MNFNEKLSSLRKAAGISQDTLAQQLGVSRQAISKWELGTAMPETKNIVQLAEIFDVTTDYLLGYTSVPYPNLKEMIKNNTNIIVYLFYIGVTVLFLICSMGAVVSLARKTIWVVRGLSFMTWEEWLKEGMSLGFDNGTYALVFSFIAVALFAVEFLIRKFDVGERK